VSLSESFYLHWVRCEGQLYTGLHRNAQRLRLLVFCLDCVTDSASRARKLEEEITGAEYPESSKYRLPSDLVDCFEANAVIIMQVPTYLERSRMDLANLQPLYTQYRENPYEAFHLNWLDKLGYDAQAAITRAEKTLASSGTADIMSMGPADAEILVSVVRQNGLCHMPKWAAQPGA
jgi:hypothetical protein